MRSVFKHPRRKSGSTSFNVSLGEFSDTTEALLRVRTLEAFDRGGENYPVHRVERCAVRRSTDALLDDLALRSSLTAHRLGESELMLDGPGVFVTVKVWRKSDYSSLAISIWAAGVDQLNATRNLLLSVVGEQLLRREMFTIDWHFGSGVAGLESASFDEMADPAPLDEAYPTLGEPLATFIQRYLASRETVLILQGPPGTGKTRLVRAILAAISASKADSAKVLYSADRRALENDQIFVEFVTGSHDAFVVEDADHLLMARSNGNVDLHRFLAIADGVVRAQGRKIIFTTNLPNLEDIDAALVRPGRCFARIRTRALDRQEATALLARIGNGVSAPESADCRALPPEERSFTLACLYRLLEA